MKSRGLVCNLSKEYELFIQNFVYGAQVYRISRVMNEQQIYGFVLIRFLVREH